MSLKSWCSKIATQDKILESSFHVQICRILHYEVSGGHLYIFSHHLELLTISAIRRWTNDDNFVPKTLHPTEKPLVSLEHLLSPRWEPHKSLPRIVISNALFTTKSPLIAVQLAPIRTHLLSQRFVDFLAKYYTVFGPGAVGKFYRLEPANRERLGLDPTSDDHRRVTTEGLRKHEDEMTTLHDKVEVLAQYVEHRFGHVHEAERSLQASIARQLGELRQRVGVLHEHEVRFLLDSKRGTDWGKSKSIRGLKDIFAFVALGLESTETQTIVALDRLYLSLMTGFKGLNYYDPKKVNLVDVNIEELSPYDMLQFWVEAAEKTRYYPHSGYYRYVGRRLKVAITQIKTSFQGQTLEKRGEILSDELHNNPELALAILWLKLDPGKFGPKVIVTANGKQFADFGEWASMPTELEFNHQGTFAIIDEGLWRYEGGESKSTVKTIDDSRTQLERRFQLVSGLAQYGFNTSVICFGKIYVPELPPDAVTRFGPVEGVQPLQKGKCPKGTQEESSSDGSQEPDTAPDFTSYTAIEVLTTSMEYQRRGLH